MSYTLASGFIGDSAPAAIASTSHQPQPHSPEEICLLCPKNLAGLSTDQKQVHYDSHTEAIPREPPPEECFLCSKNLSGLSLSQKQSHYDTQHQDLPPNRSSTIATKLKFSPKRKGKTGQWKGNAPGQKGASAPFWHTGMPSVPPPNYTPGMLPLVKKLFVKSHSKGKTVRAVLCCEDVVHIQKENFDNGWGCGYRNFLMACTALMTQNSQPEYAALIDAHPSPSHRNLQQWIENAWEAGYDAQGADQLHHKLVGTKKWIGVSDLWVAFAYVGILAQVTDFKLKKLSAADRAKTITDWVVQYFTPPAAGPSKPANAFQALSSSPVLSTDKMPLILQRSGHSQMIIGYEVLKNGTIQLLLYDAFIPVDGKLSSAARRLYQTSRGEPPLPESSSIASTSTSTSSPLNTMNHFLHKDSAMKHPGKRHTIQESSARPTKRSKSSEENENEVIMISSDIEEDSTEMVRADVRGQNSPASGSSHTANPVANMDPEVMLKPFRLLPKTLTKEQYQILAFPLEKPMTSVQQTRAKTFFASHVVEGPGYIGQG